MSEMKEWKKLQILGSRVFINPRISDMVFVGINPHKGKYVYKIEIPKQNGMELIIKFKKASKKLFG